MVIAEESTAAISSSRLKNSSRAERRESVRTLEGKETCVLVPSSGRKSSSRAERMESVRKVKCKDIKREDLIAVRNLKRDDAAKHFGSK